MSSETTNGTCKQGGNLVTQKITECWVDNFEGEVKYNTNDISERFFDGNQKQVTSGFPIHYHMKIVCNPAKDTNKLDVDRYVLISMNFHIVKGDAAVTNADLDAGFKGLVHGIEDAWNNRYFLKIIDTKKTCCNPLELPILFSFAVVEDTENIQAQLKYDRDKERWHFILIQSSFEGVTAGGTEVRQNTDSTAIYMKPATKTEDCHPKVFLNAKVNHCNNWTVSQYNQNDLEFVYAHEFGHCLGLPDEYTDSQNASSTVQYYKPNGELDSEKIFAPSAYNPTKKEVESASIMSTRPLFRFHLRHGWCFAIAAKKLISKSRYQLDIIENKDKKISVKEGKME